MACVDTLNKPLPSSLTNVGQSTLEEFGEEE